jgi:hypothetical protein
MKENAANASGRASSAATPPASPERYLQMLKGQITVQEYVRGVERDVRDQQAKDDE